MQNIEILQYICDLDDYKYRLEKKVFKETYMRIIHSHRNSNIYEYTEKNRIANTERKLSKSNFQLFHTALLYRDNANKMMNLGLVIEDLKLAYTLDIRCDKKNYKAFISQSTQRLLQNKLLTKDELLYFYSQDPKNYRLKNTQDIIFDKIESILIDPFFQLEQYHIQKKFFHIMFNTLLPFCKNSNVVLQSSSIQKLRKGIERFIDYCVTIVEEDRYNSFATKCELKNLFNHFIKHLGISFIYEDRNNIEQTKIEQIAQEGFVTKFNREIYMHNKFVQDQKNQYFNL